MSEEEFNPRMLQLARHLRGFTQEDLHKKSGVTQSRLSKFESGSAFPTAERLAAVAAALTLPASFFLRPDERYVGASGDIHHHRKRASAQKSVQHRLRAAINLCRIAIHSILQAKGSGPMRSWELTEFPIDEYEGPEDVAKAVRLQLHLPPGPIPNMVQLLEDAGAFVFLFDFGSRQVDAVSQWRPGQAPVVALNLVGEDGSLKELCELAGVGAHDLRAYLGFNSLRVI